MTPTDAIELAREQWIEWRGGNCPVPWARIIAKCRSGYITASHHAGEPRLRRFWEHKSGMTDILAYRIVP